MKWSAVVLCLAGLISQGYCALHLASIFHSHMVLQRGPQNAVVWGTGDTEGSTVTVTLQHAGQTSPLHVTTTVANGKWKVRLPAQTSTEPYTLQASSADGTVTLHDVLFGDVWLCSGQSNMYFTLSQVMNATSELAIAHQFPNIRFTRARRVESAHPLDTMAFDILWTGPNSTHLGSSSAVCWLFAQYLYPKLNYPIGLIESSWGGTPIEAWSPPEVFTDCAAHPTAKRGPGNHSVLWNSMIHPLLSYTIYGALWYQGEANAYHASSYACLIDNMVSEWRKQFHGQSLGQTSDQFYFGYVQLAGHVNNTHEVGSFPAERWAQTANYGYSPNPALPNTFMAVAMDLPDFSSPFGTIHPRYKQDVAERLVLGALHMAYGQTSVDFQGPFPSAITLDPQTHHVTVVYDQGHATLNIRSNNGFEVCCTAAARTTCDDTHDVWVAAPIVAHEASHVILDASRCAARHAVGVRYEWRTSPCLYKHCAVYDLGSGLPAPPYITHTLLAIQGPELVG